MIGLQLRHYADFGQFSNEERNPEVIQQELNIQRKRKFAVHPPYRSQHPRFIRRYHTAPPAVVDAAVNTSFDDAYPAPYAPGFAQQGAEPTGVIMPSKPSPPVQESGANVSNNTVFTSHHASATEPLAEVN